jgi:hypothetical protein
MTGLARLWERHPAFAFGVGWCLWALIQPWVSGVLGLGGVGNAAWRRAIDLPYPTAGRRTGTLRFGIGLKKNPGASSLAEKDSSLTPRFFQ